MVFTKKKKAGDVTDALSKSDCHLLVGENDENLGEILRDGEKRMEGFYWSLGSEGYSG